MLTEIRQEADGRTWALFVDGERVISEESHTVCANVAHELESPTGYPSECAEVAEQIRRARG